MTTTFVRQPRKRPEFSSILPQVVFTALAGGAFFVVLLALFSGMYQVLYWGRIFPGVLVAGVDVSGLQPVNAESKLSEALTFPYSGHIVFRDGSRLWATTPAQLGMVLDPSASAEAAYRLGRSGGLFRGLNDQLNAWQVGMDVAPAMVFDQRVAYGFLQKIAEEVDQPVVEAHLHFDGANVVAEPGKVGRKLNIEATLVFVNAQLQLFRDGEIPLVIQETPPEILDVSAQAEQARRLLSAPLMITLPDTAEGDPGPWTIAPDILTRMMTIERVSSDSGAQYQLALDRKILQPVIEQIAKQVDRDPANARFVFNDGTRQLDLIQHAFDGRTVQVDMTLAAINQGILQGQQSIPLVVETKKPPVADDATAEKLGITQLVSAQTSYFRGSTTERLQNIKTSSSQFHGLLVAPGETFSMGKVLGDVSLDNGYAEAMIIYGGRTIKGVGGGVCQVSTTLFRTVFFGGYPVAERYPHAYRVYYYEQIASGIDTNFAGMDATVYFPLVDFKFINDTPYWLLMETYFNPSSYSLTWKFYSTSDGRTVTWQTTGPQNVVAAPEPAFQLNTSLTPKSFKQVDWAADGADVTVTRTVMRNGQVLYNDRFFTHYEPWQAVYEYGPGIDNPKKVFQKQKGSH
jgi:vancomycin resistance protein YoaR